MVYIFTCNYPNSDCDWVDISETKEENLKIEREHLKQYHNRY
jgi:hypothetical protein